MNKDRLADLLDMFIEKRAAFQTRHADDYRTEHCGAAFDEQEEALDELEEELHTIIRFEPESLRAILVGAIHIVRNEH